MIRESFTAHGQCLGREWCGQRIVTDTDAPIHSGDAVLVLVRSPETSVVAQMVKYLEYTRTGRWWLQCLEGVTQIGPYFVPAAIEKIIHREPLPRGMRIDGVAPAWQAADEKLLRFWDEQSLAARIEWTSQGKPWDVPFPGLDVIVERPPQFRLPDDFYARRAA